jgi:hypothetical protein
MLNTSPWEGAVCRAMKVGKEEVIGFLIAIETWLKNDLNALNREWNARIKPTSTLVKPCRSRPTLLFQRPRLFQRPGTGTRQCTSLRIKKSGESASRSGKAGTCLLQRFSRVRPHCGPAAPRTFKDCAESSACRPAICAASALKSPGGCSTCVNAS